MAEDKPPRKRSPIHGWKDIDLGLDNDVWLRKYRRSLRPDQSPSDAVAFFRRVFDESPAATLILTPDFHIADANQAAQKMIGQSLAELRESHFQRHIAGGDQRSFVAIRRDIIERPGSLTRPLLMVAANREEVEVSITASLCRDESGEIEFILAVLVETGKGISEDLL